MSRKCFSISEHVKSLSIPAKLIYPNIYPVYFCCGDTKTTTSITFSKPFVNPLRGQVPHFYKGAVTFLFFITGFFRRGAVCIGQFYPSPTFSALPHIFIVFIKARARPVVFLGFFSIKKPYRTYNFSKHLRCFCF